MPENIAIDGDMLNSLLLSVSLLGILLLFGVMLRLFLPFLRNFFIPAALIGGFIGLALGPHVFGVVTEEVNETWEGLAGILIAVVFAPMLLGEDLPPFRKAAKEAAPQIFYSYFSSFIVVGIPALLTFFLFTPLFGTEPMFSTIFEVSWPGGHGTAAGMEESYTALGWANGSSLALGSATFGLLFGILGGMVILNIALRKGHLKSQGLENQGRKSDILAFAHREVESVSRLQKSSLDNLALHASLIGLAIVIGVVLKTILDNFIVGIPLFPLAMIGGLIVQVIIRRTRFYELLDKQTFNSITGIALDFLVVAAVASISLPVILDNLLPLLITTVVIAVLSVAIFYIIGPRIFREAWVENSIVSFGAMTGVATVGLMLLRAADPKFETNAYRNFAFRAPFASPFVGGGIVTALFPILVTNYGNLWIGIGCVVISILLVGLAILSKMWRAPEKELTRS